MVNRAMKNETVKITYYMWYVILADAQGRKERRRRKQYCAEGTEKQLERDTQLEEEHMRDVSMP